MAYKDLGPDVSQTPASISTGGSFSGEDKAYESIVIQEGKSVIDWEMNLRGEIAADYGYRQSNQRSLPSSWLDADFLETADLSGSYTFLAAAGGNESKFQLEAANVQLNGWSVRFEYSDDSVAGNNVIQLGTPPAGGARTDLVILEAWRALLEAAPATENKSPTGLILRHGNVKAPDAVNLIDDILDPVETTETALRVQIQYRYRVIEGVDIDTYPDGLDDPTVVAHTVSDFGGAGADGTATAEAYSPLSGDAGLWRAGTGDAAGVTALETVDGYMYAIPICAVFRRNSTAFDQTTNPNGGALIASGTSDRPDGLFSDQIVEGDVRDLRKGVIFDSYQAVQKFSQQLLDNTLQTEHETISGVSGTSLTTKDDIGVSGHIGDSDLVRRKFSDRAITEGVVARVDIGGGSVGSITVNLNAIPIAQGSSSTTVDVDSNSPTGTKFNTIGEIRVVDFAAPSDDELIFGAGAAEIDTVTVTDTTVTITFNTASLTNVSYFIALYIDYPPDSGISRNIVESYEVWTPNPGGGAGELPSWVESAQFDASPVPGDADRSSLTSTQWSVDVLHREANIELQTITQSVTFPGISNTVRIPEKIVSVSLVNAGAFAGTFVYDGHYTILTDAVNIVAGASSVSVDYVAERPLPVVTATPGDSYQIWYKTRAIQSLDVPAGNVTLDLVPRAILNEMAIITVGSGSPDDSFPYSNPSSQIPIPATPSVDYPEARLDSAANAGITGFVSNTGFIQVSTTIPYSPGSGEVTLERQAGDDDVDAEGRNYWARGSSSFYTPSAFTFPLTSPLRHKTALFSIMELKQDETEIGRKGTHVMVVFSKWHEFVTDNSITMMTTPGSSGASVYRIRGNLLSARRNHV
jgi:hypothetical protein